MELSKNLNLNIEKSINREEFLNSTLWKTINNGIDIVGGKSENHVMTIDLRRIGKTGKDVANLLESVGITANKNTVPNDPQSPFVTSGVRIGTAATTTRGMKKPQMKIIAQIIADAILERDTIENLRAKSLELCNEFPLYKDMTLAKV